MRTRRKTARPSGNAHEAQAQIAKPSSDQETQPDYLPRWDFWREIPTVSLDEAVALSCNIEPQATTPSGEYDCPDLDLFHTRLEIVRRTFPEQQNPDGLRLAEFAAWAVHKGLSSPLWKDLPAAFVALAPEPPASANVRKPGADDKPLLTRERDTLLKIILGLAEAHKIDLNNPWTAAGKIERLVDQAGYRVAQGTISGHLTKAKSLLDGSKD